jgi:NAD(P)-dependent dehydrogenase (short-subunit alcohol dehydrogenase family)
MMNLSNKVVVITGAGSGIGQALAWQLSEAGATVALNDWNADGLAATLAPIQAAGRPALAEVYDVSDLAAVDRFAQLVQDTYGRVDGLINNAGITVFSKVMSDFQPDEFRKIHEVNFFGVLYHTQRYLPLLREQASSFLVNVSSLFGLVGYPFQTPYVASKFAVRGLTEALRSELQDEDILISCVHPGGISTNLIRNIEHDDEVQKRKFSRSFERMAPTTPEQAARIIIRGIQQRSNRIIVGKDARRLDWIARLLPRRYHRLLRNAFDPRRLTKQEAPQAQDQGN